MTRDFSKEQRDDRRPYSRNTPSDGYNRGEGSFKSARPRLSRDAVDRAWENGATRKYADYRPRQNQQTPPAQRQGRPSPAFERSQQPRNRGPQNTRQDHFRSPSPSFHQGYQPRNVEAPETGPRRFREPGNRAPERQGFYDERGHTNQRGSAPDTRGRRGSYRDERPSRPYQDGYGTPARNSFRQENDQDGFERSERPSRPYRGGYGSPPRNSFHSERGPRTFERGEGEQEHFARGKRPGPFRQGRDNDHPRWQSRPAFQRDSSSSRRDTPTWEQERPAWPENERFEGDYERFDVHTSEKQPDQHFEPHVTRLPDGRVLKGSRPSQRKQAQFWSEVGSETQALLPNQTETPQTEEPSGYRPRPTTQNPGTDRPTRPVRKRPEGKTRVVKTVKTSRARDAGPKADRTKPGKKKAPGVQGPITRPSQRGFKWPSSDENE